MLLILLTSNVHSFRVEHFYTGSANVLQILMNVSLRVLSTRIIINYEYNHDCHDCAKQRIITIHA